MADIFKHSVKRPGLLGRKIAITQIFDDNGNAVPATIIELGPCPIVQKKALDIEGYESLQLGFGAKRETLFNRPEINHFKKKGITPLRYLKEFRGFDQSGYKVGDVIKADYFQENELVCVIGKSKGKGFAGVHKRHGHGGGRKTHGSHFHRAPGSIGACATPSKVIKGVKMPGHLGSDRVTVKNLKIIRIDTENNRIFIRGAVPGKLDSVVAVTKK